MAQLFLNLDLDVMIKIQALKKICTFLNQLKKGIWTIKVKMRLIRQEGWVLYKSKKEIFKIKRDIINREILVIIINQEIRSVIIKMIMAMKITIKMTGKQKKHQTIFKNKKKILNLIHMIKELLNKRIQLYTDVLKMKRCWSSKTHFF